MGEHASICHAMSFASALTHCLLLQGLLHHQVPHVIGSKTKNRACELSSSAFLGLPSGSEKLCRLVSEAKATPKNQAMERSEYTTAAIGRNTATGTCKATSIAWPAWT